MIVVREKTNPEYNTEEPPTIKKIDRKYVSKMV